MSMRPNDPPKYLTYAEAAMMLNISHRTVRKLAASRQIRAVKIGSCVRIPPAEMDRFLRTLPAR